MPEITGTKHDKRATTYPELLEKASNTTEVLIDLSGRNGRCPAEARAPSGDALNLDAMILAVNAQMYRRHER